MADKDFQLRIITPERVFYEGTVDMKGYDQLVFLGQFVHTEDGDNIL